MENQQNKQTAQILLTVPTNETFTYALKKDQFLSLGSFVRVPFGNRMTVGVVWGFEKNSKPLRLKEIDTVFSLPALTEENKRFIDWVSAYTLFPKGSVLKMLLVNDDFLDEKTPEGIIRVPLPDKIRLTPERKKVLSFLSASQPQSISQVALNAGVSSAVVTGLIKAGGVKKTAMPSVVFKNPDSYHGATLSDNQRQASDILTQSVGKGFSPVVLEGITGSGKTEVYFEAIAEALKQNKQVLVLLPEIGLTTQWLDRFKQRFCTTPALWHSDLSPLVRRATWQAVLKGEIKVLAGARSALFLPFPSLGLIIVDEEHDSSYKQEEGVTYHARNMAVVRAKIENIPVILSSATPSLETTVNVKNKRYRHVLLTKRFGQATLPDISLIDMRQHPAKIESEHKNFLSPVLIREIEKKLTLNEQVLLFLNRRGYAPLVLCPDCGHRFKCPDCDAWLVEHLRSYLQCHHCGHSIKKPTCCPVCQSEKPLTSCGPGAERIFEEVQRNFKTARSVLVTSDTVGSPRAFENLIHDIETGNVDILVGTQILAKGYHFPKLTLVGVVDADLGLAGGDLRAGEKTFQLLQQVSGRAGRSEHKGHVFLQTFDTENAVIQALAQNDKEAFLQAEIFAREELNMPPFGQMAALIISGKNDLKTKKTADLLGKNAPYAENIRVFGPTPAPLSLLRGNYRYRLLLQTLKNINLQEIIKQWLARTDIPSGVRVKIDIDPYSFF